MTKQELINVLADKFDATGSDSKIAFNVFIQKVADFLKVEEIIRIPEIGIFQLMRTGMNALQNTEITGANPTYQLLCVPLTYRKGTKDVITFNIQGKKEKELELIDDVFSISVGKPLIPIAGARRKELFIQSSYIMLHKTFEEKTDKLLEKAIYLKDFKIDYRSLKVQQDILDTSLLVEEDEFEEDFKFEMPAVPWDFGVDSGTEPTIEQMDNFKSTNTEDNYEINSPSSYNSPNLKSKQDHDDFPTELYAENEKVEPIFKQTVQNFEENEELFSDEEVKLKKEFTIDYFKKSTLNTATFDDNIETTKDERVIDLPSPSVGNSGFSESIEEEEKRSSKWFWIIISLIIIITAASLYYMFFIYPNRNDKDENALISKKKNESPVVIMDSLALKDSLIHLKDKTKLVLKVDSSKEMVRNDGKEKHVKEFIYSDGNRFTIQASSWKTRSVAEMEVLKLRKAGYDAYLSIKNPDSSPWFCVRIGNFTTLAEAEQFYKKIK